MNRKFKIREGMVKDLGRKLRAINRRAAKLGMEPVTASETGREFVPPKPDIDGRMLPGHFLIEFEAHGEAPTLPGWSLVARLEHDPAIGTLIHAVPGQDVPSKFQDASNQTCDHCRLKRFRKDTFVLRNESGEVVQVGRNCVVDFLGGDSAADVLAKLEHFSSFTEALDDLDAEAREGHNNDPRFDYVDLLALVARTIRVIHVDGWRSRTAARDAEFSGGLQNRASVDTALILLTAGRQLPDGLRDRYEAEASDLQEAEDAIEWAANQTGESDYESNIRKIAKSDVTSYRSAGIAGSIPAAFARHQEQELDRARKAANSLNEHFGNVGDQIERNLEVQFVAEYESQWGVSTLIRFKDTDGRTFTWWASKAGIIDAFERGATYRVKGKIKKHDLYQSERQTVLTRCSAKRAEVAA